MKKIFFTLLVCCFTLTGMAQQVLDAKQMVGITPIMFDEAGLPSDAKASLALKLRQMATQNGFGSLSENFVITANAVTIDKQRTTSPPVQFIVELQVSIYVVNVLEQVIVSEMSVNVKGIEAHENKAVIKAINQINPRTPEMRNFMNQSRTKIIDYYATHTPMLMKKASTLAESGKYDEALHSLSAIPTCVDQYPAVADMMKGIYTKKIDAEAIALINQAKGEAALHNYANAMDLAAQVSPLSTHAKEVATLMANIDANVTAAEKTAAAEKMKRYEMQMAQQKSDAELNKIIVESASKVAIAEADASAKATAAVASWLFRL